MSNINSCYIAVDKKKVEEPLICAKEGTYVNYRIDYKDAYGRPDSIRMEPFKSKVVCPIFHTKQDIKQAGRACFFPSCTWK